MEVTVLGPLLVNDIVPNGIPAIIDRTIFLDPSIYFLFPAFRMWWPRTNEKWINLPSIKW